MEFIADFHIHSKYSRATSKNMDVDNIAEWAKLKGIQLMGTGDFTHHLWLEELRGKLESKGNGLYVYKDVNFILTAEISSIYSKRGKTYRIHTIIFAPSFETVEKINNTLAGYGNIASDGRPILGLDAKELTRIIFDVDANCMIAPAHCLLPGTLIHTSIGLKKIEDITNKDYVFTHRMRNKKVTKLFKREYSGNILYIKPYYFREGIKVTPEHPFYIIKTFKDCPSRGSFCMPRCSQLKKSDCRHKFFNQYYPQWIQAKDIKINDILVFPRFNKKIINKKNIKISNFISGKLIFKKGQIAYKGLKTSFIKNDIKLDKDFCRLAGYFVSEGYTNNRDCISFCFLEDEREYIEDIIELMRKIFGIELSKKQIKKDAKGVELIFYSKILYNFFKNLFYVDNKIKRAFSKSLPQWMLELSIEKQSEIIKGWWRGDKGYTTSRVLMNQMKALFLRLGIIPSISIDSIEKHKNRGKHFIGTREIFAQHDTYHFSNLSFFEDKFNLLKDSVFKKFKTKSITRHGWIDDKYVYLPIRAIKIEKYQGTVYNLEVKDDNSYVCEFATVHNCWTPWFSLFGSMSGFNSIEECFEELTPKIFAIETGLSSDPAMNWRLSKLDRITLISNSDSHSPQKIGREANVFNCELNYNSIADVLKKKDKNRFLYTVEFFPEEGKYHYDGHRICGVRFSPKETKEHNNICPKCGKRLTVGVMSRVGELADRKEGFIPENAIPYKNLIPLDEIIADSKGVQKGAVAVEREYRSVLSKFGTEFEVLVKAPKDDLYKDLSPKIAEGIMRVREGKVHIKPGFDGEYGQIEVFSEDEKKNTGEKQLSFF